MIDRKLDPRTGDIAVENYDAVLIDGLEQIAQNIQIRLKMFLGEWFRDMRLGIPWFSDSFTKADLATVDAMLKSTIKETPGMNEITYYSGVYEGSERKYTVNFKANTIYGLSVVNNLSLG